MSLMLCSMGFTCSTVIPDGPPSPASHFKVFENKLSSIVKTLSDRLNSGGAGSLGTCGRRRNWFNVSEFPRATTAPSSACRPAHTSPIMTNI